MSNKKEENKQIFDKVAEIYDFAPFQWWMRRFYRPVFSEVELDKSKKLLDVSCGTGNMLKEMSEAGEADLYGVDLSENMIEQAKEKLKDVDLQTADVHSLPFENDLFDYVTTTEAFHHYYGQSKAIAEMKRVVKPGGKVIVVDIEFFFSVVHRLFEQLEPGCVKVNSKEEMRQLFKQQNLDVVRQERSFLFAVMTIGSFSEN